MKQSIATSAAVLSILFTLGLARAAQPIQPVPVSKAEAKAFRTAAIKDARANPPQRWGRMSYSMPTGAMYHTWSGGLQGTLTIRAVTRPFLNRRDVATGGYFSPPGAPSQAKNFSWRVNPPPLVQPNQ